MNRNLEQPPPLVEEEVASEEGRLQGHFDELRDELARGGFTIDRLLPSVYDTPLTGLIDVVGGLSLPAYRYLTDLRRRLVARWPQENAGFYAVCSVR